MSVRYRTLGIVALGCVAILLLAGCGGGGSASASLRSGPLTEWLEGAARVAQRGIPEGRVIAGSKPVLEAPAGVRPAEIDDLIRTAPQPTDPEVAQALRALQARRVATALAAEALGADQQTDAAVAATAATSTNDAQVRSELQVIGGDVVKDIACGQFLDLMQPAERKDAQESGEPAWVSVGLPTAQAIVNATARRLTPGFSDYVAWGNWGFGIGKDADELAGAAQQTATTPDAAHTRAFYYYVRICLKSPS